VKIFPSIKLPLQAFSTPLLRIEVTGETDVYAELKENLLSDGRGLVIFTKTA